MMASRDLFKYGSHCVSRALARCRNTRGAKDVHDIDHRNRGVCLGERRGHSGKRARTQSRPAKIPGQQQSKKSGLTKRLDSFGRKSAFGIFLTCRWRQYTIGNLTGFRNSLIMSHERTSLMIFVATDYTDKIRI